jgi:hypothetical protein
MMMILKFTLKGGSSRRKFCEKRMSFKQSSLWEKNSKINRKCNRRISKILQIGTGITQWYSTWLQVG